MLGLITFSHLENYCSEEVDSYLITFTSIFPKLLNARLRNYTIPKIYYTRVRRVAEKIRRDTDAKSSYLVSWGQFMSISDLCYATGTRLCLLMWHINFTHSRYIDLIYCGVYTFLCALFFLPSSSRSANIRRSRFIPNNMKR